MGDLSNPRLIILKGLLFLAGAVLASVLILLRHPSWQIGLLLAVAIWCSARFYYFAFYVIERYVDKGHKFSGLWSAAAYLLRRREHDK